MSVTTIKQTYPIQNIKLLTGQFDVTTQPGNSNSVAQTIPHQQNYPILFKVYFRIDSGKELYYSPIINSALSNDDIGVIAYVNKSNLVFEVNNNDTIAHICNVTYFIYVDRIG